VPSGWRGEGGVGGMYPERDRGGGGRGRVGREGIGEKCGGGAPGAGVPEGVC